MRARSAFLYLCLSALSPAACTAFSGADTSEEDATPRLKPKGGAGGVAGAGGEAGSSAGQGGSAGNGGIGGSGAGGTGQSGSGAGGSAGQGEGGAGAGGSASGGEAGGGSAGNGGGGSPAGSGGASGDGGAAGSGGSGGTAGAGGSAGSGGSAGGGTAPAGWQGPFRVSQAPLGQEPPGFLQCGGGVPALSYVAGVGSPSSSCSPCACGAMTGASCVGGGMAYSLGGSSCLDIDQSHPAQDWAGSCFNLQAPLNGKLVVAPLATSVQAGSCPASGGEFSPGAYTGTRHRLCDQATGAAGEICVLGPPDTPCPDGWQGSSKSVAKDYEDKRTCGACSCDTQQLPTCGTDEFDLMFAENCLDFGPYPKITQECSVMDWGPQPPNKTWSLSRKPATPKGGGSCTPKGGGVQGSLTLTGPATLCCAGG